MDRSCPEGFRRNASTKRGGEGGRDSTKMATKDNDARVDMFDSIAKNKYEDMKKK